MIAFASTIQPCSSRFRQTLRKERRQLTIHHVYSQVHFGALRNFDWNKVLCTRGAHDLIHEVFANRTPGESVKLLNEYWRLVQFRSGQEAIEYLGKIYWQELFTEPNDPDNVWPDEWRKHLAKHEKRTELIAVFKRVPPSRIARWIRRLDLLTGYRTGEEAINYLSECFWNGFVSDEWAILQWCLVRKPRKPRREKQEHQEFRRPRIHLRLRSA